MVSMAETASTDEAMGRFEGDNTRAFLDHLIKEIFISNGCQ